ncbi:hypothetical protein J8F10_07330 [Gemmata sp. G18]|uniref:STAS domain-containing protein n=1 Tax=Gemmata palustris TaxID=2822762 RepID=A0ABS5BN03_9BACT|nr:hypothetical protein [Gemmata palustris]MBP3955090.1 hypothetical protein [Gemmata palustris]
MVAQKHQQCRTTFTLIGDATATTWAVLQSEIERRLGEEPGATLVIECGRVTGCAPDVFLAIAALRQLTNGRLRVRNWPDAVLLTVLQELIAPHVLGSDLAEVAAVAGAPEREALHTTEFEAAATLLSAALAKLKHSWFGDGAGPAEPGA